MENTDAEQKEQKAEAKPLESEENSEDGGVKEAPEGGGQEKQEKQESIEEAEDFKGKYLYLAAELENQRKRFQRERENLLKFGGEKILHDLVEVVDNLERTVAAIESSEDEKIKNIVSGIDMVKKQFLHTLACHGLTSMDSLGEDFDPSFHEAMAQEESDHPPNRIIRVFERGYKLNGRLLRAAKVIVAK